MAKLDPKDARIEELEAMLRAANEATVAAELKAQVIEALEAELLDLRDKNSEAMALIKALEDELAALREVKPLRANVSGLEPTKAVQLKVSGRITNATTKSSVRAVAGDVVAEASALAEVQRKLGAGAKVHPVSKEDLEAIKKSGRAY